MKLIELLYEMTLQDGSWEIFYDLAKAEGCGVLFVTHTISLLFEG